VQPETGELLPPETANEPTVSHDPVSDWHRSQAIECNNGVWDMVSAERTPANDEEMLRRAYASAYHWQRASGRGAVNEVRALYMIAKAQLLAGQPELSMRYADSCLTECQQHGIADFDLAYAHEARARALAALARGEESLAEWAAAKTVPIADPEDQAIVDADFADAPQTS
jgi:hypothetical protein